MATIEVFMGNKRYTDEFKAEAVKQVVERGFPVTQVASRIGVSKHTLYEWVHRANRADSAAYLGRMAAPDQNDSAEVRRLKAELKRVTEERDILKKAAAYFAKG